MIDTDKTRRRVKKGLWPAKYADVANTLCDEVDRLRKQAALRECQDQRELANASLRPAVKPQPQGKTVRVKVAVAVSSNGEWTAAGWHDGERDVVVETAMDAAFFPANIYWLTADLPIPEETTVKAEVNTATTDENATSGGRG